MVKAFNLFDGELDEERTEPVGFTWRAARLGPKLGGTKLGASLYELQPGERSFPYHYEYGAEEWLAVVSGRPTLRVPDGEHELRAGDVVCFPEGPEGAHKLTNTGGETVRVILLSDKPRLAMAVYPDSDKIGVFAPDKRDDIMVRRDSGVDYYDREL